jgi:thiamine kinase-like enzyme
MLGLGRTAEPHVFVTIEPRENAILHPSGRTVTFRVPLLRDVAASDAWLLRSFDTVPRFHRTPRWDPHTLAAVAHEVSKVLERELIRPGDIPSHWRPMHGDFVPWNLREDRNGLLWLLDWEDAGWAPPNADLVRYAVAYQSIYESDGAQIAGVIRRDFPAALAGVMTEAALFWTTHPNLRRPDSPIRLSKGQMGDFRRSHIEHDALMWIAHFGH